MKRIAIVGAGIAGLALAEALRRQNPSVDVVVLEKRDRAGGNIRTEIVDGYTCEWGPNGFLDNVPETLDLVRTIGLEDRLQVSRGTARRRFIYRGGRLHELSGSPAQFIRSPVLSWPGKGRMLLEPFARQRPDIDETIHAFAARHLGREAADVLVDPVVSGLFAGDARRLSLRACFPRMWALDLRYRSLLRGMFSSSRRGRRDGGGAAGIVGPRAGRLTSFRGGMEDLIGGLLTVLGDAVQVSCPVSTLDERPSVPFDQASTADTARRFVLSVKPQGRIDADAVALTAPAQETASIVARLDPAFASALAEIPTAPVAVVCLGYDAHALSATGVWLDGFGFLVPFGEPPRILGALWDCGIYPGRAPSGKTLVRVMIGGARDPGALDLDDETLVAIVRQDLRQTMGIGVAPELVRIIRHRVGIPQYTAGHLDRLDRIEARRQEHAGLFLAGSSYRGVSLNHAVAEAAPLARRILASL